MLKAIEKKVFQGQKDYEHLYFKLCDGNYKEKNMSKKKTHVEIISKFSC